MTHARRIALLAGATAVAFSVAIARWRGAETLVVAAPSIAVPRTVAVPIATDSILDDAQDATITNDPFRLANEPSSVRYDPSNENGAAPPAAPVVRPTLVLKAIIGGPPWQAVIDGIPGQPPGAVASAGSRFDRLVVRSVWRDSVVVQGPDTTWTLAFRGRM